MAESTHDDHKKWYEENRPKYELLSYAVRTTLESLIKNAGIPFLSISTRAKEIDSFVEKIRRKSYKNPSEEITDLAGIRIITFIEADALKVNDLIKSSFDVNDSKSLDKSNELGIDKFGYRSFHFICGLGKDRCALPEFKHFKDFVFEIQVRTVLQHAWAEIEHDRNYKFAGDLPNPIKRRLHLLAGLLELADGEFNNLSNQIDNYSQQISLKTKSGDLNIEINSISLARYCDQSENVAKLITVVLMAGFKLKEELFSIEDLLKVCKVLNITTIEQIDSVLESTEGLLERYFTEVYKHKTGTGWYGDQLFFITLILLGRNLSKVKRFNLDWHSNVLEGIISAATKVFGTKKLPNN